MIALVDTSKFGLTKNKTNGDSENNVPKAVVSRLSLYLRELLRIVRAGESTISSTQLGKIIGVTGAQVRKDFANFGQFGYPGIGYRCDELIENIREILGTKDRMWPVILIGCGNLGQALLGYNGFDDQGFMVQFAYDVDSKVLGQQLGDLNIRHLDELEPDVKRHGIKLAIVAVPAKVAQDVTNRLVEAGITGILNFAPVTLNVPETVTIAEVDLAIQLEQLSFAVVKQLER